MTSLKLNGHTLEQCLKEARYADVFGFIEQDKHASFALADANHAPDLVNLQNLQKQLSKQTSFIHYYAFQDEVFALIISNDAVHHCTHLAKLSSVSAQLERLDFIMLRVAQENTCEPVYSEARLLKQTNTLLKDLYSQLLEPLELYLGAELIISPYSSLNAVPFAALFKGESYLGERYLLSLSPSATVYKQCVQRKAKNPVILAAFGLAFEDIPFVEKEVKAVSSLFRKGTAFLNKQATLETFRQQLSSASLLHIATHTTANVQDSGLRFYDACLSPKDLTELSLNSSLVVLSACETALNKTNTLSLAESFLLAGSFSVVASLWAVKDGQTAELMIAFYTALIEGKSVAQALQTAQAKVRKEYANPYYWAAFNVLGDAGQIVNCEL